MDNHERLRRFPNGELGSWIRFASSVVLVPLVGAALVWVMSIDTRMTVLESWAEATEKSRFRAKDWAKEKEWVRDKLDLKADKADVPPPIVKQRLDRAESDVASMKITMSKISEDLAEIKGILREIARER